MTVKLCITLTELVDGAVKETKWNGAIRHSGIKVLLAITI